MSRGIYGFAICRLKSKVYLWLLYCTKGKKFINVSTCSYSFYFERSRIHLSVIARKKGGGTSDRENLYSDRGLIHKYTVCSREKSAKSLGENAKPCLWYRAMIWQHSLHIREYWLINRWPGFLALVGFGFSTITHPPPPLQSISSTGDTQEAWSSKTHSILLLHIFRPVYIWQIAPSSEIRNKLNVLALSYKGFITKQCTILGQVLKYRDSRNYLSNISLKLHFYHIVKARKYG